jgi:hypothetical protein
VYFNPWRSHMGICQFQLELFLMWQTRELTYPIVTTLTVLFFVLPLLFIRLRQNLRLKFTLTKIRRLFNYTFLLHIGLGLLLHLTFIVFGESIFGELTKSKWFKLISMATVWFYIIGLFYYAPAIVMLNLIIELIHLIKKKLPPNKHLDSP